jgi:hypothetical protein
LRCETVGRYFVQPAAGIDAVYLVVSGLHLSASKDDGLLQRVLPHGLLREEKFRLAICARRSAAKNRRPKSSFTARTGGCGLVIAGTSGRFNFFRQFAASHGDPHAALHAALRLADLIHFSQRP